MSRRVGFSNMRGKYKFFDTSYLHGLYLKAEIMSTRNNQDIRIANFIEDMAIAKYNRESRLKLRCRVGLACPQGFEEPCEQCVFGTDSCPAGVRPVTLVVLQCPCCAKPQVGDPSRTDGLCVDCERALNFGKTLEVLR